MTTLTFKYERPWPVALRPGTRFDIVELDGFQWWGCVEHVEQFTAVVRVTHRMGGWPGHYDVGERILFNWGR